MGPATGKPPDYTYGLAAGMGRSAFDMIIAETGGIVLKLVDPGPPPTFEQFPLKTEALADLERFRQIIKLKSFLREFTFRGGKQVYYRPQSDTTKLTLFPSTKNLEETRDWVPYFEEIIKTHKLRLVVQRFSDGCLDVLQIGVSKGEALKIVCPLFNCRPAETLTLVDGVNDSDLAVGTMAIAPSNAIAEIKELVKRQGGFVADYEDGMGFAQGVYFYAKNVKAFGENSKKVEEVLRPFFPV